MSRLSLTRGAVAPDERTGAGGDLAGGSALRQLDFLTAPFRAGEGVERRNGEIVLQRPWAMMRFSGLRLQPGWWRFECEVDGIEPEVRLGCDQDPLIVFTRGGGERVYLQGSGLYECALLVSPWPGRARPARLRLRRLSAAETLQLVGAGVGKVLRSGNPAQLLVRAARRAVSGQPLGMNVRPDDPGKGGATPTRLGGEGDVAAVAAAAAGPPRVEAWAGVRAALGPLDQLDPRAQEIVSAEFVHDPRLRAIYCDVCAGERIDPLPGWDPELARWHDFGSAPVFFREDAWRGDGSPAWEQLKALAARHGRDSIGRIALPLAVRPPPPPSPHPPAPPPPAPLYPLPPVSVILPTKLRLDLLRDCLEGLASATNYPLMEVVIVDNGCDKAALERILRDLGPRLQVAVVDDFGDFNFSRLINSGADVAAGEVILILNDDIEPFRPGWLHRLVESVQDPSVGAVGARLLYPDGSVQHAGITLGLGGVCGHLYKGATKDEAARTPRIVLPGERLAVTGACLAVRREVFDEAGGFDEQFPVGFNDVDFCLRLYTRGYRNVYRGDAVLVHHESQSRGLDDADGSRSRRRAMEAGRFHSRWRRFCESDPYSSPAFDPRNELGVPHRLLLSRSRR